LFTAEAAKIIGSYDPATNKVDWVLGRTDRTYMIYVWPDLKRIATTNVSRDRHDHRQDRATKWTGWTWRAASGWTLPAQAGHLLQVAADRDVADLSNLIGMKP